MFKAKLEVKGVKQVNQYFNGAVNHLINPAYELAQVTRYMENTIFPKRFNDEKNPAGGKWKPSVRVLLNGGKTLTDKRDLRNSMRAKGTILGGGRLDIDMYAKGKLNSIKAAVHNNGLRIRNRGGGLTKMPKRQFAFITRSEKEKIIYDIFLRALEVA